MMDNERTAGEKSEIEDEAPVVATEYQEKPLESSPEQATSPQREAQLTTGSAMPPTRQRNVSRIVLYAVFLLIGIVLGVVGMLLFQLSIGGTRSSIAVATPAVSSGNVTVHADQSLITPLLQNSVQQIALPGNGSVSNVQFQFSSGNQMDITGNYQLAVLGVLPVTQTFSLSAQLLVSNCQLQIHILQANFSNISVTGLVSLFEDNINQKLAQLIPQNNLPGNIEFCLVNVATDAQGITATFSVVVPSSSTPTAVRHEPIATL